MMRTAIKWITASRWNAVVITAALGLLPLFKVVSGGVVALSALRRGFLQGAYVAGCASLLLALLGWLIGQSPLTSANSVLAFWLPVLCMAEVLRRTGSLALAVQFATLLGILGVSLFLWQTPDPVTYWQKLMDAPLEYLIGREPDAEQLRAMAWRMTGMLALIGVLMTSIALLLGRWAQSALDKPGTFGQAFRSWHNGKVATVVASVVFIASVLTDNIYLQNMALVLLPMLLLQGLAIAHFAVYHLKMQRLWLVGLYVILLPVQLFGITLVVLVGFLDEFFGFRAMLAHFDKNR